MVEAAGEADNTRRHNDVRLDKVPAGGGDRMKSR